MDWNPSSSTLPSSRYIVYWLIIIIFLIIICLHLPFMPWYIPSYNLWRERLSPSRIVSVCFELLLIWCFLSFLLIEHSSLYLVFISFIGYFPSPTVSIYLLFFDFFFFPFAISDPITDSLSLSRSLTLFPTFISWSWASFLNSWIVNSLKIRARDVPVFLWQWIRSSMFSLFVSRD